MTRLTKITAKALVFLLALTLAGPAVHANKEVRSVQVGEYAPLFSAKTLEGENFSLLSHRGKTVLLSFWTTWCYRCMDEMVFLQRLAQDLSDTVIIVGVSEETEYFGVQDLIHIENLMGQWGIEFPTLIDEGKRVWDAYGLRVVPTSVIIDHNGRVQLVETYFFTESEEKITLLIELLDALGQEIRQ